MAYLYIDESGDLGFGKHGSDYFILTCVKIDEDKTHENFKRIPKKIRMMKLPKKLKYCSELKFTNSNNRIRMAFLQKASKLDIEIYSVVIQKHSTYQSLQNNLPILYNYLIKVLLESPLGKLRHNNHLTICLDRCMSASQRVNFENYIKTEFLSIFQRLPKVEVIHESSQQNSALQVLDFICGAFGYKYNTAKLSSSSDDYTNIIKSRIVIEKTDLFKQE